MHHTQALKTLLQCLEDLTGTVESFGREQKLHDVEKDLVLYRGRLLYESILKLPTEPAQLPENLNDATKEALPFVNGAAEEVELPIAEELSVPVVPLQAEINEEVHEEAATEPAQLMDEDFENAPDESVADEHEIEHLTLSLEEELSLEKAAEHSPEKAEDRIKSIQIEHFSITEVLRQSGDKDLILTHLKLKPIQDLKSGIGLNEKFLFIRELFENDHQAYALAVESLNGSNNLDEAEAYIANELMPRYGWELEKEALLNFLHLILRRFSNS